jgi:ribosome biogenesis GTPase
MKDADNRFRLEEEFHAQDRKLHRKARKLASYKDRSKFKKSDQDQLKKRSPPDAEGKKGRVLAVTPEGAIVDCEGAHVRCTLKGTLKQERKRMKNLVAVGDFVRVDVQGAISSIEERRSVLSRADNLSRTKEQLIAVNIDQVLITASVVLPALKPFLIDRYIIAAHKGRMEPVIVINKIDLLSAPPSGIVDALGLTEERALFDAFVSTYRGLGIPIFPVSAETGEGIPALLDAMRGRTSVFSGQSGVGKSSLINAVLGSSLKVGEIVGKTSKGAHTTTAAHLIPLEGGGFCIDTPGIRSFGVWALTPQEVKDHFAEIRAAGVRCRFPDCAHLEEPDCAVKEAVEREEISPLRFASYRALMESLRQEHRHR